MCIKAVCIWHSFKSRYLWRSWAWFPIAQSHLAFARAAVALTEKEASAVPTTWCYSDVWCLLQRGKGKAAAAASVSTQPQLASQSSSPAVPGSDPDPEASPLKQDIIVTTQLLESFNTHSDTWEALEVSSPQLDLVINPVCIPAIDCCIPEKQFNEYHHQLRMRICAFNGSCQKLLI